MQNLQNLTNAIDAHITAIEVATTDTAIQWHASRCRGKIRKFAIRVSGGMMIADIKSVEGIERDLRNRLVAAMKTAFDQMHGK